MILPGCHSDSMLCEKFLCISLAFIQLVPHPYVAELIKPSVSLDIDRPCLKRPSHEKPEQTGYCTFPLVFNQIFCVRCLLLSS